MKDSLDCSPWKFIFPFLLLFFCACASSPRSTFHINENEDPDEQFAIAEQELLDLRKEGADFLAPSRVQKSETALVYARELLEQNQPAPMILRQIEKVRAWNQDLARLIEQNLGSASESRAAILDLDQTDKVDPELLRTMSCPCRPVEPQE